MEVSVLTFTRILYRGIGLGSSANRGQGHRFRGLLFLGKGLGGLVAQGLAWALIFTEDMAQADCRTLSNFVRLILEDWLSAREKAPAPKPGTR